MIYFDNAATSYPKAPSLYSDIGMGYNALGVSPARGSYSVARELDATLNNLRSRIGRIFGVTDNNAIIITPSATFALNQIIQGIDYSNVKNIYISPFEHNAVIRPLKYLQSKYGFSVHILPFQKFAWNMQKTNLFFKDAKPDIVFCSHASNVFGNILPVSEIFRLAKKYGATTVLDCAQTAGLLDVNVQTLCADFAVFAGHKTFYGPSGIGGLIINSSKPLTPLLFGGTGIHSEDENMPESMPERYEAGSLNSLGIIGLSLSMNWLDEIGINRILSKKNELTNFLFQTLERNTEVLKVISDKKIDNVGIISVEFRDYAPSEIAMILDRQGICIRHGLHCAPLAIKHIGGSNEGTVRFSVGYFNSMSDIEQLDEILHDI